MTESLYYFAGAAAANVLVNGADFSTDTLFSLAGPLGVTIGAAVGIPIAARIINPGPNEVSPGQKEWLSMAVVAGCAVGVAVYGGASVQQAATMAIGGGAAAMLLV